MKVGHDIEKFLRAFGLALRVLLVSVARTL